MFLSGITVNVYAPELSPHHSLSHSPNISVSQQRLVWIKCPIVDAVVMFNPKQPGEVIMTINKSAQ